jgi:hypothetical protein
MEIKIVDEISPLSDYLSRTIDLFAAAPVLFYQNDPANLVLIQRTDNVVTVNKRGSFAVTDRNILDIQKEIKDLKEDHCVFDLDTKRAIYNMNTMQMIEGFSYFPPAKSTFSAVLIETSGKKLKKTYKSSGNHSLLWAIKSMKNLPFKDGEYNRLGIFAYLKAITKYYGLTEISFRGVYESEIEGIEQLIKNKHSSLASLAVELKPELEHEFVKAVNDYMCTISPTITGIMGETGIPITRDFVTVEQDIKIEGIEEVRIKDGVLYIKADLEKLSNNVLFDMFGDEINIIPSNIEVEDDDIDDIYGQSRLYY